MSESEEISQLITTIVSYARPKNILLFGSRARGAATPDSDIDLCILYENLPKRNLQVLQDLYKSIFPIAGHAVDLVVYQSDAFSEKAHRPGSFEQIIQREGQVIYGA